jgi:GIY-YIG catalytic domain
VLPPAQDADLRQWQSEHLYLTWAECDDPWRNGLEAAVIAHFKPPLNSRDKMEHPFHDRLTIARKTFRDAAPR